MTRLPLNSADVPILTLVFELQAQGFIGVRRLVEHRRGLLFFDLRHASRKYLQACLASEYIFDNGKDAVPKQRSQAFYSLLLRDPASAVEGLSAAQCEARIQALDNEAPAPAIPALALVPPPRPVLLDLAVDGDDGDETPIVMEEALVPVEG